MYYDGLKNKVRRYIEKSTASSTLIPIEKSLAPCYLPLHSQLQAGEYSICYLPGGRGSCKSSFVSLEIVDGMMKDPTGQSNAIVIRRFGNTLRESVFSQISWAISMLGAENLWRGTTSPLCYTYLPTGTQILFRGTDDPQKLKSIRPRRGFFRYVWFEELCELPGENTVRSIRQSVVRGGDNFISFYSFNPPKSKANWANKFILQPDERAVLFRTDYTMIPPEWLGDEFLTEAARLKEINRQAYDNEYGGLATGEGGEVFDNIEAKKITNEEIANMDYFFNGLDFGFAVDPCAYVRLSYDRKKEVIYILDEIYKTKLSNQELADIIISRGYNYTGKRGTLGAIGGYMPYQERTTIVCDCAEPKSIADLQGAGLRAIPCRKYNGSVVYGVRWLQRRRIVIDPARTPNAYREFTEYSYTVSKDGEILSDLPDKGNHTIDAVRYALDGIINQRKYPA